jgi:CHAT domain-containing protein/tetratricopeptide (TPR) repeat protein
MCLSLRPLATGSVLVAAGFLWQALCGGAARAEEAPPWQRVLAAEDSRRVEELEKKIAALSQAGKYDEAQAPAREVLDIRTRVQGADHWQTSDAKRSLRDLQRLAALPPDAQAECAAALKDDEAARQLVEQGRSAQALPSLKRALDTWRRHLGEEHPDTAVYYFGLAGDLEARTRYADAEQWRRKALDLCRQVFGDEHPRTAAGCNNLARNLQLQGQYAEAERYYREAVALTGRLDGPEHQNTIVDSINLAMALHEQGKYAEAAPLLLQGLTVFRRDLGKDHPLTAYAYNNLGTHLADRGQYAEAELAWRQSREICVKAFGEENPNTVTVSRNLGLVLAFLGKGAEAEALLSGALKVCREKAGERHLETAKSYLNLAYALKARDRYADAQPLFRKALEIAEGLGEDRPDTARGCYHLARNLYAQGRFADAEPLLRRAVDIFHRLLGEEHPDTLVARANLALTRWARGDYQEAEELLATAAHSFETARLRTGLTGLDRAEFAALRSPLPSLAACRARAGKAAEAWQALEASLARGLLDDIEGVAARPLQAEERRRERELIEQLDRLDRQIQVLAAARKPTEAGREPQAELRQQRGAVQAELARLEADLTGKYGVAAGEVYDWTRIQAQLPADAALLAWIDVQGREGAADPDGEHWAALLRRAGPPVCVRLPGSGPDGAWTPTDDSLRLRLRQALGKPADWQAVAEQLSRQRLAPLAGLLGGTADLPAVRHLIVLPAGWMAGVPVEALTDRYTVSYAPSGTLLTLLREKRPEAAGGARRPASPSLLALGDPAFAPPEPDGAPGLRRAGGPPAAPLPGTRREVDAISRLFGRADKLLGPEAAEARLVGLAKAGRLRDYRFLHLATHADMDDQRPLQSALLLADGRLTVERILHGWDLDADLVTLSACRTGLGRPSGGEGYVGFSQALFLAGARGVLLSLWEVDDRATSLLMTRFYENLLGKRPGLDRPLSKVAALQEAKQWLRQLTAEQAGQLLAGVPGEVRGQVRDWGPPAVPVAVHPFEHPYYWSAFILIGEPGDRMSETTPLADGQPRAPRPVEPLPCLLGLVSVLAGLAVGQLLRCRAARGT